MKGGSIISNMIPKSPLTKFLRRSEIFSFTSKGKRKVFKMFKRLLIMVLGLSFLGIGLILAQEPPPPSVLVGVRGPKLIMRIHEDCCRYDDRCSAEFIGQDLILVKHANTLIYNLGDQPSGPVNGTMEFYDSFNDKRIYHFTIGPVPPKSFSNPNPAFSIFGPFLVKRGPGIKATITYRTPQGLITKSFSFSGCGSSDWSEKPPKR